MQTILTKDSGIRSLGLLEGTDVEVWTENGWEFGHVELQGSAWAFPTKFDLSRPSGLPRLVDKDERGWVRRGNRESLVFVTEGMPWYLTDDRVVSPMLENRTVPCAAPTPSISTEEYRQGIKDAELLLRDRDIPALDVLGEPVSTDYVFGVIMHFTRKRPLDEDSVRRVLYTKRRDVLDWVAQFSSLGGYIMTSQVVPKVRLEPANESIGWKNSGVMNPPTKMKVYQVKGVSSQMMTLRNGIYAMSENVHEG